MAVRWPPSGTEPFDQGQSGYFHVPYFVGTEPAVFTFDKVDYEAVVDMHLAGHVVYSVLDDAQKAAADAGPVPENALTGLGKDGLVPPAIGLDVAEMTPGQKELLMNAISRWVQMQPEENAGRRMAEISAGLDRTTFAWTGTGEVNMSTYMRIQGPALIVELLSTGGNVGQNSSGLGHYHTIYRNSGLEYGGRGPTVD